MIKFCCYSKCDNSVGEVYIGNNGVLYLHLTGCSFTLSLNGPFSDGTVVHLSRRTESVCTVSGALACVADSATALFGPSAASAL